MGAAEFQPLQGMYDLTAPEVYRWQELETTARRILHLYAFEEIRTPLLERTELFTRSVGDTTDMVQKEMYSFTDRGGRDISLRPEGTASVIRHVAAGGPEAMTGRYYYMGPMFRSERPQAGRFRQFRQLGIEALGEACPAADAEVMAMQVHLLDAWGLEGSSIQVNTRGLPEDQEALAAGLRDLLLPQRDALSEDSRRRLDENVLRVIDSKAPEDRAIVDNLPPLTSFLSEASRAYFEEVQAALAGLGLPVTVNPKLVRGLDYYVHTVWEITHPSLGAQDALCGGGRYRINLGKKTVDGVGFAMGLERVLSVMATKDDAAAAVPPLDVMLVSMGERALAENLKLAQELRGRGMGCRMDLQGRSMKAQMRAAQKMNATWVVIRGDDELEKGEAVLKQMATSEQETLPLDGLFQRLEK